MLIVVEYRDIADFFESAFDFKASWRGNILQIHAAEASGYQGDGVYNGIHVVGAYAERNCVHVAEFLEEGAFALHNGHARLRTDIAQTQHRRAVGYYRDKVGTAREVIAFVYILLNFKAGLCHSRRIGEREILARLHGTARHDFYFALPFVMLF